MADVDAIMTDLKTRVGAAERAKMLAELRVDQALKEVEASTKTLADNFQVSSPEEAKALIEKYRKQLEEKSSKLLELLAEFEGSQ